MVVPEVIPFTCAYPLETNASLNAAIGQIHGYGLMGSGARARAHLSLFSDSSFSNHYPVGQITLPVGSALHVQAYVYDSDPSFAVVLGDCYTTYSSNPDDPSRYYLIHYGCSIDPHRVSVVENGLSSRARFSALVFPLRGDNPSVYLHCRLHLCDRRSQNCVPFCRRRVYRSLDNPETLEPVTIGPLTWKK
ncbi:pancreatic secretory granule membrane major glycoprotein GP2-like [Plectropomus leopardus]|nr:pancreatic secretory granule membrane major glycoprotein GP2-like [Plectropomus leopardus]